MSTITAKIFRYDPSVNDAPYYKEYEVEHHEWMTALEVLRYIHENCEPIAFDYNCRGGSCGLCAMKVNGKPVLACTTVVNPDEELVIEPLDRFPVIRDLIVDKRTVVAKALSVRPQFLRDTPMVNPATMAPESYQTAGILQQCRECMICMSVCPAIEQCGYDNYAGPYVMTRIAQRFYDDREGHAEERLRSAVDQGLFNCIECGTCTSVCPKGEILKLDDYEYSFIDHVKYFKGMKDAAREAGLEPVPEEAIRPLPEDMYSYEVKLSGA